MASAQKLLYLFADPVPAAWVQGLNPSAESLERFYAPGKFRSETYEEMVEEILSWVRKGLKVCAVFYGHPGVFGFPPHEAIRRARSEGFSARMLPGVSAEDCLYADLGVDPGDGCQSFEATNFLLFPRTFDPTVSLVLWQVAAIGELRGTDHPSPPGLKVLEEYLERFYGREHEVVLYEASPYAVGGPTIQRVPLRGLSGAQVRAMTTLYVPPKGHPPPDLAMFDRLEVPRREAEG
jgi:uncharacterized protein YabN with tetrapyrrole methylase and pyrophosphatase domain